MPRFMADCATPTLSEYLSFPPVVPLNSIGLSAWVSAIQHEPGLQFLALYNLHYFGFIGRTVVNPVLNGLQENKACICQ